MKKFYEIVLFCLLVFSFNLIPVKAIAINPIYDIAGSLATQTTPLSGVSLYDASSGSVRLKPKSCSAKVAFNPRGSGKPIKYQRGSNLIYNQGTFENLYGSNSKYGSDSIYGLDERTADKLYGSALLPQNLDGSFYPQQPELNCPAQINEEIVNGAALY